MAYLAVIEGQKEVLTVLTNCFAGSRVSIREKYGVVVLESEQLLNCTDRDEAFQVADIQLEEIHQITAAYLGLFEPLSVSRLIKLDANGNPCKFGLRGSITINVFESSAIPELCDATSGSSFGSDLLEAMQADEDVKKMLGLFGTRELTWHQIYDILEFLGGSKEIDAKGLASENEVAKIRRTANHYRHLGTVADYTLFQSPPSLGQASLFVRNILKKWLASRLNRPH